MWKSPTEKPYRCFIGCPHLTLKQLEDWADKVEEALKSSGKSKLVIDTVFTASPAVLEEFKKENRCKTLLSRGAHLSYICPLMYADNPLCGKHPLLTNSNKLRTYTKARYEKDEEILALISGNKEVA